MKLFKDTRWLGLIDLAICLFVAVVTVTVIVHIPIWWMEQRLARPDPHAATIARTGPAPCAEPAGHPYPKRPCPDCLLKHKWGACLTNYQIKLQYERNQ